MLDLAGALEFRTDRFQLRPLSVDDSPALFRHLADPAVTEFMDIDPLVREDEAQAIIAWAMGIRERNAGLRWGIRDRDGAFLGTAGFNTIELERGRRGEVAYDIRRASWGQGVMGEVLPPLMVFGFEGLGLRRLEAMVTVGNEPSCRLLERHGFQREGVLRDHGYWKGGFWDQVIYGRLAT
jgi:ribosomal-protein-alanine N-acetyltransferase